MAVKWCMYDRSLSVPTAGPLPGMRWVLSCMGFGRPVTHPMEVGSKARKDHRQVTTNDAGPGGRSDPRSTRAEGHTGSGDPTSPPGEGKGVRRRVPVLAADPEDDRDGAEPGDDTGDEVEGHDAALLTLVGWSMRRPQMTPSIVIPSRGRRTRADRAGVGDRRGVFLDRRDEVRRAEEGDGVADPDVVGGNGDDHDAASAWRPHGRRLRPRSARNRATSASVKRRAPVAPGSWCAGVSLPSRTRRLTWWTVIRSVPPRRR